MTSSSSSEHYRRGKRTLIVNCECLTFIFLIQTTTIENQWMKLDNVFIRYVNLSKRKSSETKMAKKEVKVRRRRGKNPWILGAFWVSHSVTSIIEDCLKVSKLTFLSFRFYLVSSNRSWLLCLPIFVFCHCETILSYTVDNTIELNLTTAWQRCTSTRTHRDR